jgi:hypothetical protein
MGRRLTFWGVPSVEREDGDSSLELEILQEHGDVGVYATIGSWDDASKHKVLTPFLGHNLRITVDVLPSPMDAAPFEVMSDRQLDDERAEAVSSLGEMTEKLMMAEDPLHEDKGAAHQAHDVIVSLHTRIQVIDKIRTERHRALSMDE